MKKIIFDEGYKEYQVGESADRIIRLRPDPNMLRRFEETYAKLDSIGEKLKTAQAEDMPAIDAQVREMLNEAFGCDICTPAFGSASVFTPVGDGDKMLMEAFFEAFLPVLKEDITDITKTPAIRPEVTKYTEKPAAMPSLDTLTADQKQALIALLSK